MIQHNLAQFIFDYPSSATGKSLMLLADCLEWLERVPENTFHAVVTDPPYGVKEYAAGQLEKRSNGKGGVWRIPPSFDGHQRAPLPRLPFACRHYATGWRCIKGVKHRGGAARS